jgi:hypothetical protein
MGMADKHHKLLHEKLRMSCWRKEGNRKEGNRPTRQLFTPVLEDNRRKLENERGGLDSLE